MDDVSDLSEVSSGLSSVGAGSHSTSVGVLDPIAGQELTPPDLPMERLEAQICSLAAELASSTCEWLRLIAEFDRRKGWTQWGIKSAAHWLSWACSVSPQAAREYLRVARALEKVPVIRAAFAAGRLSFSKVKAITRAVDLIDEQTLLEQALLHTASQLERVVRAYRKTESAGPGQQRRRTARWFWDEDGMLVFSTRLPPDEGAILLAALRSAEHSLGVPVEPPATDDQSVAESAPEPSKQVEPSEPSGSSEPRDSERAEWTAADALMAMAQNALAAGQVDSSGDDRHLLVLHVDAEVLGESDDVTGGANAHERGERRCHLEDGPGLARSTMQRLICDAAIIAVVRTSLGPTMGGEPLRLGHKTRKISSGLRRALRLRDGGCQHPGCHRRRHLEAHHIVHWKDNGPTDLGNLLLLCRHHHMLLHEGGFTITPADPVSGDGVAGRWVFHRPDKVEMPAVRNMYAGPEYSDEDRRAEERSWSHELIHTDGQGERFDLAESVGVFCRATDDRAADHHAAGADRVGDRNPEVATTSGEPDFEEAEFYNLVKINNFSNDDAFISPGWLAT